MSTLPTYSVIVPTYKRRAALERCLAALDAQTLARDRFEVIVVDDGSPAPPRETVARVATSLNVRLIEQANAGPASARNAGARAARGEYVVFTDDDCCPAPEWLAAIDASATRHPGCAIGGRVVNALGDGLYSSASQLLIEFLYDYFNDDAESGRFFITSNLALPARSFHGIGGFDVSFPLAAAEDRDLCDRWREARLAMVYCEEAVVHHEHALGPLSFCRQHFNYGRGAFHLHCARAKRGERPLRVEPPRFYSRLVGYPFGRGEGARALPLAALMAVSQCVYVIGYVTERVRSRAPSSRFAPASAGD
jgi:glycosyltransferase involved in cell wall biosynthesis